MIKRRQTPRVMRIANNKKASSLFFSRAFHRQFFLMLLPVLFPMHPIHSAELNWSGEDFFVMTRGMRVAKILEDLGANYGVPVIVSNKIDEIFVGTIKDKAPEEILENFSSLYHLIWYFDGRALHVCKASEITQVIVMPKYLTLESLQDYVSKTDVLDPRSWSLKKVPGFNAFELAGPPAFIARMQSLISELDEHAANLEENLETIEIFPLKHAHAEDQTYQYQGNTITLPGVVSLLSEMTKTDDGKNKVQGQFTESTGLPLISADPRKNAVIIRDFALNLSKYRKLIEELDQVQDQVQISVTIIDIDVENSNELGVNFSAGLEANALNGSFGFQGKSIQTSDSVGIDNGFGFSSKIKDCLQFDAKLRALQTQSRAHVVAQPSIMTLNNTKAILDKSVTFYTKVSSKEEAKLETITSGTLLEVTPSLSPTHEKGQVRLQIHLRDGKIDNKDLQSGLPQTQDSEIVTQAILNADEGLLLGGFVREENSERKENLPWLGNLPLIGSLFSSTTDSKTKLVRLFFIKAVPISLETLGLSTSNPRKNDNNAENVSSMNYMDALNHVDHEAAQWGWREFVPTRDDAAEEHLSAPLNGDDESEDLDNMDQNDVEDFDDEFDSDDEEVD